ncbi:hypothetical protein JY651_32265 [Pyxidicoccus parkwayensis]|uniref:Lipoprotein n=1 Tax=Pyxidicoccus parkwayensis TaxID=2813578 RepID=A0ABX7NM42_9BACT|nr:hypothetical protein [Pyxidicoccus parkwaysis]QSQ19937.1 hypothetical protein JY651_32265 [Pyxidicoccus parkwaysis]
MSPLSPSAKLRSWLGSSRLSVPLLVAVSACGLGAPRSRRMRALGVCHTLLGAAALGVLGWRAARASRPPAGGPAAGRGARVPFVFTWQISEEEITASAASGH